VSVTHSILTVRGCETRHEGLLWNYGMNRKVLLIGLDGGTWTVLKPYIQAGLLPNLSNLCQQGCWGELQSTFPPLTAPAWSSFLTGKNPGNHGVFHFKNLNYDSDSSKKGDEQRIVDGRSIQSSTLWDILGHFGRKVGVINVPMSYPPRPVNGFMITCLLTPPTANVFSYPASLSKSLTDYKIDLDRFIADKPFSMTKDQGSNPPVVEPSLELVNEFLAMEQKRGQVALELMRSEPWDVFMVTFTATDRMGHYLWPFHLSENLDGSDFGLKLHAAIKETYICLDEMIGKLISESGEGITVFIISDHGMGPIYTKNTHWNNWLYKKGYIVLEQTSRNSPDTWLLRLGLPRDKIGRMMRRLPGVFGSNLRKKLASARTASIDTKKSKAYYLPFIDPVGGIRVNAQDQEKRRIIDELITDLNGILDPSTGTHILRWAKPREEVFSGPYMEQLPEIILLMHSDYGSSDRLSHYSAIATDRTEIGNPGGHYLEGIFIARGPEIAAISQPTINLHIVDIAPTVLYAMGLPIPRDMDGRVIKKVFTPKTLEERPEIRCGPMGKWPSEEEAQYIIEELSQEDENGIKDHLRALGYL